MNKNKYDIERQRRASAAKQTNESNRNKAKAYLSSTPNIHNIIRGLYYGYKGTLDKEDESGAETGVAPIPGRAGGYRNGYTGFKGTKSITSTKTNLNTGNTTRLNYKSPTGKHATSRPQVGEELKEGSLGLSGLTPWEKAAAYTGHGTPNQWKAGAAMGATAVGVTAGVPWLNQYTDRAVNNMMNGNRQTSSTAAPASATPTTPNRQTSNNSKPSGTPTKLVDKNKQTTNRSNASTSNASSTAAPASGTPASGTPAPAKVNQTNKKNNASNAKPARLQSRNSSSGNYTIEKGDTLYGIAKRFTGNGNNYKELLKYNNIKDTNKIYVGDSLKIPDSWRKNDIKKKVAFSLPSNLDEDYAQLQPREGGRTL